MLAQSIDFSFGGVPGATGHNQVWSFGTRYEHGPFGIGAGYLNARDPNVSFYGNTPNKGLASVNNIGSPGSATTSESFPSFAGYAPAKTLEIYGIGGSYTLARTTISSVLTRTRFDSLGSAFGPNPSHYSGDAGFTSVEFGVRTLVPPHCRQASRSTTFDAIRLTTTVERDTCKLTD